MFFLNKFRCFLIKVKPKTKKKNNTHKTSVSKQQKTKKKKTNRRKDYYNILFKEIQNIITNKKIENPQKKLKIRKEQKRKTNN